MLINFHSNSYTKQIFHQHDWCQYMMKTSRIRIRDDCKWRKYLIQRKLNDLTYDFWCYFSGYILTADLKCTITKRLIGFLLGFSIINVKLIVIVAPLQRITLSTTWFIERLKSCKYSATSTTLKIPNNPYEGMYM